MFEHARAKQILGIWKLHLGCRTRDWSEKFFFKMGGIQLLITDDVGFLAGSPRDINGG